MAFVFSPWYFVMIALVVGIVACLAVFFKMDKKDKEIIQEFIEKSQSQEVEGDSTKESTVQENKTE